METDPEPEPADVQERACGGLLVEMLREKEDDEKSRSQALAEMLRQLFPDDEYTAVLNEGFRSECKHLHTLVKVFRWPEVEDTDYLVETPQVQQAIAFYKGLNRTSSEIVRGWQLYLMLVVCQAAAARFVRESSFEQGHAKELRISASRMVNLSRCLKGNAEKILKFLMGLLGTVSKIFHVSHHIEIHVLLDRLHLFWDHLYSESLVVFWAVVQEIGPPSLAVVAT